MKIEQVEQLDSRDPRDSGDSRNSRNSRDSLEQLQPPISDTLGKTHANHLQHQISPTNIHDSEGGGIKSTNKQTDTHQLLKTTSSSHMGSQDFLSGSRVVEDVGNVGNGNVDVDVGNESDSSDPNVSHEPHAFITGSDILRNNNDKNHHEANLLSKCRYLLL